MLANCKQGQKQKPGRVKLRFQRTELDQWKSVSLSELGPEVYTYMLENFCFPAVVSVWLLVNNKR